MGSTSRDERNTTNQIDSRQIHTTTTTVEAETENTVEDSNNLSFEDKSEGKITAGGNVTVQSEAASIAASEAAQKSAEEANETARKAIDSTVSGFETFSDNTKDITEAAFDSNTAVTEAAFDSNRDISETAIEGVVDASENALESNLGAIESSFSFLADSQEQDRELVAAALDGNQDVLEESLHFLKDSQSADRASFESNFRDTLDTLDSSLKASNELSQNSLSSAFQSTVGGLAEQQQKTLLTGVSMIAVVLLIIFIMGARKK